MIMKLKNYNLKVAMIIQITIALAILFWISVIVGNGQTPSSEQNATVKQTQPAVTGKSENPAAVLQPVMTNYREIRIGMTGEQVKDTLGKAKVSDDSGFYYELSDDENAQIVLDADKKVRVVSITYTGGKEDAPQAADIFGANTEVETKPDGSIYKLVEYPQAGYWIAYYRGSGESPTVIVTMQKL